MDCRGHERRELRFHEVSPLQRDAKPRPDDRLRCGGAEADDRARPDDANLGVEPWPARANLDGIRLLVNAPLPARFPLEMLHDVRDVHTAAIDARLVERFVEKAARRSDEGAACEIFAIARLLADQHDGRALPALAEDGLCAELVEIAGGAAGSRRPQLRNRWPRWNQRRGGLGVTHAPGRVQQTNPPRCTAC